MGEQTREKEAETWAEFIREFLNEGGVIYDNQIQEREVVYEKWKRVKKEMDLIVKGYSKGFHAGCKYQSRQGNNYDWENRTLPVRYVKA